MAAIVSSSRRLANLISLILLASAIIAYLIFAHLQGILSFSIYDLPLNTLDTTPKVVDGQLYNLYNIESPLTTLDIAQKIADAAPKGVMLAPPELCGLIPMIDGFHPQTRTRKDGNRTWFSTEERVIRENASNFTAGNLRYLKSFSQLLKEDIVRTIVLRKTIFDGPLEGKTKIILQRNGFTHEKEVGDYLIVWK
jgi:hypothetical protein